MGESIVIAENVSKEYKGRRVLTDISFRIRRGEIFGIFGPEGSGKSVLARILSALSRPTSGRVMVAGYDVILYPRKVRSKVGIVLDIPTLDVEISGRENLRIYGALYGLSKNAINCKVDELLEALKLKDVSDTPLKMSSNSTLKRFEIAKALLHDPEVLIIDDALSILDDYSKRIVWEYKSSIMDEKGITVILATHSIDEAEKLCDRVAFLSEGRLRAIYSPKDLRKMIERAAQVELEQLKAIKRNEILGFKTKKSLNILVTKIINLKLKLGTFKTSFRGKIG